MSAPHEVRAGKGNVRPALGFTQQSGDNPDYCPQVSALAHDCGQSERAIQSLRARAVALNLLEVRPRRKAPRKVGKRTVCAQTTNRYVLLLPDAADVGEFKIAKRKAKVTPPVDKPATGVQSLHPSTDRYLIPNSFAARRNSEEAQERRMKTVTAVRTKRLSMIGLEPVVVSTPAVVCDVVAEPAGVVKQPRLAAPLPQSRISTRKPA